MSSVKLFLLVMLFLPVWTACRSSHGASVIKDAHVNAEDLVTILLQPPENLGFLGSLRFVVTSTSANVTLGLDSSAREDTLVSTIFKTDLGDDIQIEMTATHVEHGAHVVRKFKKTDLVKDGKILIDANQWLVVTSVKIEDQLFDGPLKGQLLAVQASPLKNELQAQVVMLRKGETEGWFLDGLYEYPTSLEKPRTITLTSMYVDGNPVRKSTTLTVPNWKSGFKIDRAAVDQLK